MPTHDNAPGLGKPAGRADIRSTRSIARGPAPEVQIARDLAEEFISEIAGRPEPWPELLLGWASRRGLTVVGLKAISRAVVLRVGRG